MNTEYFVIKKAEGGWAMLHCHRNKWGCGRQYNISSRREWDMQTTANIGDVSSQISIINARIGYANVVVSDGNGNVDDVGDGVSVGVGSPNVGETMVQMVLFDPKLVAVVVVEVMAV